jgi:hypothetical protein
LPTQILVSRSASKSNAEIVSNQGKRRGNLKLTL